MNTSIAGRSTAPMGMVAATAETNSESNDTVKENTGKLAIFNIYSPS